ncbi:MAG TPA: hydrogenase maturation protease [Chloroflexia bacterium]|nr:hydrogenase maturation protease [Chloroflexia bacterium]
MDTNKTLFIGIGNEWRSDDGVGLALARLLRQAAPPNVTVLESSGEGASLLALMEGAERVYLADALCSKQPPGTIQRFDLHSLNLSLDKLNCSSHLFGLAEALEVGRALNCLPAFLIFYGIEGQDFSYGQGLTPAVESALTTASQQILAEIKQDSNNLFSHNGSTDS